MKIYVGNLSYQVTEDQLRDVFAARIFRNVLLVRLARLSRMLRFVQRHGLVVQRIRSLRILRKLSRPLGVSY